MDDELLRALKALSDASRLRVVGLLASGRRMAVEELATDLGLSPGTVVHHLKRLSAAGLVRAQPRPPHVEYELRKERLAWIGAGLSAVGKDAEPDGAKAGRAISKAHESKLRQIKSLLDEVLSSVEEEVPEEKSTEPTVEEPEVEAEAGNGKASDDVLLKLKAQIAQYQNQEV